MPETLVKTRLKHSGPENEALFGVEGLYGILEALGPEHEYAIVDEYLRPLPIVDKVIKHIGGRIRNNVAFEKYTLGKELQCHVAELKSNHPFRSPVDFEETMHEGIIEISEILSKNFHARLLGSGMHPTLKVQEAKVWPHRDRQIYDALARIFNIRQHGWLNIQAYQLNLSYKNETDAVQTYNQLANILPYLPALSASSPIYESRIGSFADNRLRFYKRSQSEIPSITGDVIPEYIESFDDYRELTIRRYSKELLEAGAQPCIVNKEWINSRGAILRFNRRAIEIRIMDEQECIKADVALSCLLRASLRGLLQEPEVPLPHKLLVEDFNAVVKNGLDAKTRHPKGSTARDICHHLYRVAEKNALPEEKKYLWIIEKRIENGNLSDLIKRDMVKLCQATDLKESISNVYNRLVECLERNRIYT